MRRRRSRASSACSPSISAIRRGSILASVIRGIVSQRLIPRADGLGMVPAVEVLVASARVREYIADKTKTRDLHDVIAQGHTSYGMQTFDQSLMALFRTRPDHATTRR